MWGDASARREFTYAPDLPDWIATTADDLADWPEYMNVGAGVDHSIRDFYDLARTVVGYDGELAFDTSKPSGVPQRLLDSTLARQHGWTPKTDIRDGMHACYAAFLSRTASGDLR